LFAAVNTARRGLSPGKPAAVMAAAPRRFHVPGPKLDRQLRLAHSTHKARV